MMYRWRLNSQRLEYALGEIGSLEGRRKWTVAYSGVGLINSRVILAENSLSFIVFYGG